MIRFESEHSTGAEAWVIELADGRLLGTTWHLNQQDKSDHPNAYAISLDRRRHVAADPFDRDHGPIDQPGRAARRPRVVHLQPAQTRRARRVDGGGAGPPENDFGVESNEIAWRAQTRTQSGSSGEHTEWTDFSFGEPAVALLPDNTLLLVLWCVQPAGQGIRYVRMMFR